MLLSFLVYYYDYSKNETGRTFWILIIALILILLGGLQYRVGIDSVGYDRFYEKLSPLNYLRHKDIESSRFAPGFIILASFTKLFSTDRIILNFILSIFVCGTVIYFFSRNTKNIFFAILMFFIFMYTLLIFEQIREAFAVGIFLWAWPAFVKRQWLLWYALSICAIMFHTSASIMFILPLILLPGIRQIFIFGKRTFFICAGLLVLAFILKATFSKYIELLAVTDSMTDLTQKYADSDYVEGKFNIIGLIGALIKSVIYPVIALISLNGNKKAKYFNQDFIQIEMFVLISIYLTLLMTGVPIIGRYNNYFFFFPILVISDWVFKYLKFGKRKIRLQLVYWIILLLPMFGMQIYSYWSNINKTGTAKNYMVYYPYTSKIDREKDMTKERAIKYARRKM